MSGSNLTREEQKTWTEWYHDPHGTTPNRDALSRSRPVSYAKFEKKRKREVEELYQRMVAKGIAAG